jgi:type I restriction enzyme R subunit
MSLSAGRGVAVRELKMAEVHGLADYMLFVDGKAVAVLEAKAAGYPLTSVEIQADKYATGLPPGLNPPVNPLPLLYLSTGVETRFIKRARGGDRGGSGGGAGADRGCAGGSAGKGKFCRNG